MGQRSESDSGGNARRAMAQNQILEEMQGMQWPRIRFWRNCKACNRSESDSGGIARRAMAQNQILEELQGVQRPQTGFYEDCRACNGPKPGFTGIAEHAMAQNRVLRELQGMQRPKTGFYEKCRACKGPKTKSGGRDRIPHPRYIQACVMKTLRYAAKPPRFYLSSDSALVIRRMASMMASSEAA